MQQRNAEKNVKTNAQKINISLIIFTLLLIYNAFFIINFDLPKVSKINMNMNFELLKVSKMTSLNIYISPDMKKLEASNLGTR